jgi:hypothetical protein
MRRVLGFVSAVAAGVVGNAIFDFAIHHPPATASIQPPPAAVAVSRAPVPQPDQPQADPAAAVTMVRAAPVVAAIAKTIAALPTSLPQPAPAADGPGPGNGGLY